MTDKQTNKTEGQHTTAVLQKWRFSASYDSFVVGSSAVLRLNFCAKNPPLRQAAKRYIKSHAGTPPHLVANVTNKLRMSSNNNLNLRRY